MAAEREEIKAERQAITDAEAVAVIPAGGVVVIPAGVAAKVALVTAAIDLDPNAMARDRDPSLVPCIGPSAIPAHVQGGGIVTGPGLPRGQV